MAFDHMCPDSRQGCVSVELSLYLPPQSCWAVAPEGLKLGEKRNNRWGMGRNLKLRPAERELDWQDHGLFLRQECRRCWSLSRNVLTVSKKLCKQIAHLITALHWTGMKDCRLLLGSQPFVWRFYFTFALKRYVYLSSVKQAITWVWKEWEGAGCQMLIST